MSAAHSASLFATDIPKNVEERDLYEVFNGVSCVASVRVCRDARSRESLGHAYINFNNVEDAEKALTALNYTEFNGVSCRLMWCQRDPTHRRSAENNLFIKGLSADIDHKQLHEAFKRFGTILSCKVAKDRKGASRGFGFVQFNAAEAADTAIAELDGQSLDGQIINVAHFKSKQERISLRDAKFTNLYVKDFPPNWELSRFQEVFGEFGEVTSLALKETHNGLRFAFVNFAENSQAKAAIAALHGQEQDEMVMYVQPMQNKAERQRALREEFKKGQTAEGSNLYVKNLSSEVFDSELRAMFEPFGDVESAKVMMNGEQSRCFGFVCFREPRHAQEAAAHMNKAIINDRPLYVTLAERKDQRLARLRTRFRPAPGYGAPMPVTGVVPAGYMWPMQYPHMPAQPAVAPHVQYDAPAVDVQQVRLQLSRTPACEHKQIIGEAMYSVVSKLEPELCGKITGMLLEMTFEELDQLMSSKSRFLAKVTEAKRVLMRSRTVVSS